MAGGYASGRFMRESTIQDVPLPLALGVVGLVGYRRAGRGPARSIMSAFVGAGAYGAGKLGEKHGREAGNDGNLFSWSKKKGTWTD